MKARVIKIVSEQSGAPIDIINPESNLVADLGMDSLDLLEAGMSIESEFDIYVPDEEFERYATVGDIIDLVTRKVGA